jgi:LemA protein
MWAARRRQQRRVSDMGKIVAIGCLLVVLLAAGLLVVWGVGIYNGLVSSEERVTEAWAQVETTYQRRADLIPNLVSTVRGAADFEQETLTQVVEARSRVGQMKVENPAELINDPAAFARFEAAQGALSSALQRLLVVVERYPELRAVAAFQDLMVQLEGTENRINVARTRFNEAARNFNVRLRRIPNRWFVAALGWGFETKAYFESRPGAEEAPEVSFD